MIAEIITMFVRVRVPAESFPSPWTPQIVFHGLRISGGVVIAKNVLVPAGYLGDHELATAMAKASADGFVGRRACSKAAGGVIDSQFSRICSVMQ
jgi:hypothetical protein